LSLLGLSCLVLVGCWGAPQWYDDEAQGREVRQIKEIRDAEWNRRAQQTRCRNAPSEWWFKGEL
jgi:hypothetical protein